MGQIRKIFITGGAGIGKTTLATKLAEQLGVRFTDLDSVMWKFDGSGEAEPPEIRRQRVTEISGQSSWVVEGSYVGPAKQIWQEADLIVFIEASLRVVLWRIFKRHALAELRGNNRHKGWLNLLRFMKVVFKANRDPYVGDLTAENDEPKLTFSRLVAMKDQFRDKTLMLVSSADINKILSVISDK